MTVDKNLNHGTAERPSLYYHEHEPDFVKEYALTNAYLEGKSPIKTARNIRIIVIGAGASAISFAREVNEGRIENAELVVYEKNAGIGGTWWENRYAGCACDIPSHNYQYSWAPNPDWSQYYSSAGEIRRYFEKVAHEYDLNKYVKLEHQVVKAVWNEVTFKWEVIVKCASGETITDVGDILVNAGGIINNWKMPNIPGLETFKGELMHTAVWNEKYDFKDKNTVVIGNGSSGVQVTAALSKIVQTMTVVMRSPTWITAGFALAFAGPNGTNFEYTEEQKQAWRDNPEEYLQYRKRIEAELNNRAPLFLKGSPAQQTAREFSYNQMVKGLAGKPELIKNLIPSFDVGCRRPTPGNGYLEALSQDNVTVSWGAPQQLTEKSIILHDGVELEPDVIVCATGFDLSYKPRFPLVGRNGVDLGEYWTPDARAYMSLTVPNFPNYFHYLGPATAAAHGSLIPPIERLTEYCVKTINKFQREGYVAFEPLQKCVDDLYAQHQEFLSHTVWSSHCTSTFKNGSWTGKPNLLHGGTRLHYFEMLQDPRWEDYQWTTSPGGRQYDYLGDGTAELDLAGLKSTWYLDNADAKLL